MRSCGPTFLALIALSCARQGACPETPEANEELARSMRLVCDVDRLAGLDADEDPIGTDAARWDFLMARVEHPEVIEMLTLARVESPLEQAERFQKAAEGAGLDDCALARTLERQ